MADQNLTKEVHHPEAGHSEQLGMPQLDDSSFASQLFWLVVVFAFLYAFMASAIIPRIRNVLGKRQHQIQHDLDTAEKARNDAGTAKASYESELAGAKDKASTMIQKTQKEIDQFVSAEQANLSGSLEELLKASEENLASKRDSARSEIEPMLVELTTQITESILGKKPDANSVKKALTAVEGGA